MAMDKEAAVLKIFDEIYVPQFVEKCASKGVVFENKEDLKEALATVLMLKQANVTVEEKAPAQSIFKQASLDLKAAIGAQTQPAVNHELIEALNTL